MRKVAPVILLLGLIALGLAVFFFMREQSFLSGAEKVTGSVTDYSVSSGLDGDPETYCPIIEFTASNSMKVSYESDFCTSPPSYAVGDQVQMYYNPSANRTQMKGFWSQNLSVIVLTCIGLLSFLLGLGALFARKSAGKNG